jgi:imidazolonepropionase
MMLNLSCILFSLSPVEALTGVTRSAAQALGRLEITGTVSVGKEATVCVWDVQEPASLVSDLTTDPLVRVFIRGEERHV